MLGHLSSDVAPVLPVLKEIPEARLVTVAHVSVRRVLMASAEWMGLALVGEKDL